MFGGLYFGLYAPVIIGNWLRATVTGAGYVHGALERIEALSATVTGAGALTGTLTNVVVGGAVAEYLRTEVNDDAEAPRL